MIPFSTSKEIIIESQDILNDRTQSISDHERYMDKLWIGYDSILHRLVVMSRSHKIPMESRQTIKKLIQELIEAKKETMMVKNDPSNTI